MSSGNGWMTIKTKIWQPKFSGNLAPAGAAATATTAAATSTATTSATTAATSHAL